MPGGLLEPRSLPDGFVLVYAEYIEEGGQIESVDLRYEADVQYLHIWQTRASPKELGQKDPVAGGEPFPGTQWNRHPLPPEQVGRDGIVEYSRRLDDGRTVSIDSDLDQDTMRHVLDSVYLHGPAVSPQATSSPQLSFAPTPTLTPLSRDAAIAAARAFAGIRDDTPVASAAFGPFGEFEPDPNQKNSPPAPDHLVWQVIFGSTDTPRAVILDYYSGALIELGAAISDASPLTRDEAIAAARNAAGASYAVTSARLGLYQDLHLTPITSSSPMPPSQLVGRIDFDRMAASRSSSSTRTPAS
jgi:hypothetical protein